MNIGDTYLKAAGLTNPKGVNGTIGLNNGKICITLTADDSSTFFATSSNEITAMGITYSTDKDEQGKEKQKMTVKGSGCQ